MKLKLKYEVKMANEWDTEKKYPETFIIEAESSYTAMKFINSAVCPNTVISIKLVKETK